MVASLEVEYGFENGKNMKCIFIYLTEETYSAIKIYSTYFVFKCFISPGLPPEKDLNCKRQVVIVGIFCFIFTWSRGISSYRFVPHTLRHLKGISTVWSRKLIHNVYHCFLLSKSPKTLVWRCFFIKLSWNEKY